MVAVQAVSIDQVPSHQGEPLLIKRERIVPSEHNPRKIFDDDEDRALADSIMQDGQNTPIEVRKLNETQGVFEVVKGERRWRACGLIEKRTGKSFLMKAFVTVVRDAKDQFKQAFIENMNRSDMHALDVAAGLLKIKENEGATNVQLGIMWGHDPQYVGSYLKLNDLDDRVKAYMTHRRKEWQLQTTVAIQIAGIPDKEVQFEIASEVMERQMSLGEAQHFVATTSAAKGYHIGGENRKPSDDFKVFTGFLGRVEVTLRRYRGLDFKGMYLSRFSANEDVKDHLERIEKLRRELDALEQAIQTQWPSPKYR